MPRAPPPRIAAADVPRPKNRFEKSPPEKFGQAVLGILWCPRKEKMIVPSQDDKSWDVENIANTLNLPSQMRHNRRKLFRCVIYHLRN